MALISSTARWRTVALAATLVSCSRGVASPPDQPPPTPSGVTRVEGGVVTLGDYQKDPAHWGRREAWLAPYLIDRTANPGSGDCRPRRGRIPTLAELEHALRSGAAVPATAPEQTSTLAIPEDAEALAEIEGVGFYDVLLGGLTRVLLEAPDPDRQAPWRCVVPAPVANLALRVLRDATEARRGRGEHWPVATGFFALGAADRPPPPRKLGKGMEVALVHQDGAWSLVARAPAGEDLFGWVPTANLAPH